MTAPAAGALPSDALVFFGASGDLAYKQWRIVDPILDRRTTLHVYEPGTWGPAEADSLVAPRRWLKPIEPVVVAHAGTGT